MSECAFTIMFPHPSNQVEYHPLLVQTDLLEWCKANDVHLQTYRSLGKGQV